MAEIILDKTAPESLPELKTIIQHAMANFPHWYHIPNPDIIPGTTYGQKYTYLKEEALLHNVTIRCMTRTGQYNMFICITDDLELPPTHALR